MPKIFGEGRPPGQERWIMHFDHMTAEDEIEWQRWKEELRKPLPETDEIDARDVQPKSDCGNVIDFCESAQIFRMRRAR